MCKHPTMDRSAATSPGASEALRQKLADVGESLGSREAAHGAALEQARKCIDALRQLVADGLESFHAAAERAGAPHLRIALSDVRLDDKHVRALEFELRRGRHVGIVTVKSRGDVTLVGPFRYGRTEGPCRTFPADATTEIHAALGDFLASFLEEAATP